MVDTDPYAAPAARGFVQPWPAPCAMPQPFSPANPVEADVYARFGWPATTVAKADRPPMIDGALDDAAWKQAQPLAFRFLNGRSGTPEAPTVVRMLCDDRNLYVAFDCADDDMARLSVRGKARDDNVRAQLDIREQEDLLCFGGYFGPDERSKTRFVTE